MNLINARTQFIRPLAILFFFAASVTVVHACQHDSDCAGNNVCNPDTQQCVAPDSGGSTNTGPGGGSTNAGPGGGSTNLGPSGGSTDLGPGTGNSGGSSGALVNPLKANDLGQLITDVLGYVVKIGTVFLTFMLVYVGFLFVSAQGNNEKLSTARSALLWTVVGGLLLLGAQAISMAISATVQSLTS